MRTKLSQKIITDSYGTNEYFLRAFFFKSKLFYKIVYTKTLASDGQKKYHQKLLIIQEEDSKFKVHHSITIVEGVASTSG